MFTPEVDGPLHREVVARFDGGQVTSDAGSLLLRETERVTGVIRQFLLSLLMKCALSGGEITGWDFWEGQLISVLNNSGRVPWGRLLFFASETRQEFDWRDNLKSWKTFMEIPADCC